MAKKQGKTRVCVFVSWLFGLVVVFFHVVSLCSCFSWCTFFVAKVWFVFAVLHYPKFVLLFSVIFWGGGGGSYSSFYINHFNGPAPVTKNKIKTLKTPTSEIFVLHVLLWGLHPHTFSHLAHRITVTLNPPPLKIVLVHLIMFLILCWNVYFTVFFEHQPNLPPKSALNKNDNFAQCAKQNWVF